MEKFIGQEYTDPQEREQFLKDNADAIEKMGYSKPIPSEPSREVEGNPCGRKHQEAGAGGTEEGADPDA